MPVNLVLLKYQQYTDLIKETNEYPYQRTLSLAFELYLGKSVQEPLVIIISDPASILHLSQHVPHCVPRHALERVVKIYW